MSKHLSMMRFLSAVLLLDIVLIGLVFVSGPKAYAFLSQYLPGTFGPGMGPGMTGNHFLGALILKLDALLFLSGGFAVLANAARNTLMIGSRDTWRLLRGTAGLSREDIAATSFALAEEQKAELHTVHTGRSLVWIGAVLLLLAFPAVCFTFARANAMGAPLLQDAGGAVANSALSIEDAAVFAVDQLAGAVLLDIPQVFQLHVTSLMPAHNYFWLRPFVLLFHILSKLVVLAILFAAWRGMHLRACLLQMAGPDAVPVLESLQEAPPAPHQESEDMLRQAAAAIHEPMSDHGQHVEHHLFEAAPVPHAAVEHTMQHEDVSEPGPIFESVTEHEPQEQPPMPEPAVPDAPVSYEPVEAVEQPALEEGPVVPEPAQIPAEMEAAHSQAVEPAPEPVFDAPKMEKPVSVEVTEPIAVMPAAETGEHEEPQVLQSPVPDEAAASEAETTTPQPAPKTDKHPEPFAAEPAISDAPTAEEPASVEALGPIPVEPVYREPEQMIAEPVAETGEHAEPPVPQPPVPEEAVASEAEAAAPAPDEVEHPVAATPLALHEPGTDEEAAESSSGAMAADGPKPPFPYRHTALHVPQEFDA